MNKFNTALMLLCVLQTWTRSTQDSKGDFETERDELLREKEHVVQQIELARLRTELDEAKRELQNVEATRAAKNNPMAIRLRQEEEIIQELRDVTNELRKLRNIATTESIYVERELDMLRRQNELQWREMEVLRREKEHYRNELAQLNWAVRDAVYHNNALAAEHMEPRQQSGGWMCRATCMATAGVIGVVAAPYALAAAGVATAGIMTGGMAVTAGVEAATAGSAVVLAESTAASGIFGGFGALVTPCAELCG